jgi:hypothetical protein
MAAKTPTQRNISAVLAKARHVKSVSSIRGLRNHSDGYAVTAGSRKIAKTAPSAWLFTLVPAGSD